MADPPRRTPAGTPTGGRFAPSGHNEAALAPLTDDEPADNPEPFHGSVGPMPTFDEQLTAEHQATEATGADLDHEDSVWSWTTLTGQVGEPHARELFDRCDASLGRAAAVSNDEWATITDRTSERRAIIAAGHKPSDFTSPDGDVRRSAATARGDLAFEDELLPAAYRLSSYGPTAPSNADRGVAPPKSVPITPGIDSRWVEQSVPEKLAYFDGYAAATEAITDARARAEDPTASARSWNEMTLVDRGRTHPPESLGDADLGNVRFTRRAGWNRAIGAAHFADDVDQGPVPPEQLVHVSDGTTVHTVHQVTPVDRDGHRSYVGTEADQPRPGATPAQITFGVDAVVPGPGASSPRRRGPEVGD